jgi:hypothetical protein
MTKVADKSPDVGDRYHRRADEQRSREAVAGGSHADHAPRPRPPGDTRTVETREL